MYIRLVFVYILYLESEFAALHRIQSKILIDVWCSSSLLISVFGHFPNLLINKSERRWRQQYDACKSNNSDLAEITDWNALMFERQIEMSISNFMAPETRGIREYGDCAPMHSMQIVHIDSNFQTNGIK